MGSITSPRPLSPAQTPFDLFAALLALASDPATHAERIAELRQAQDEHRAIEQAARAAGKEAASASAAAIVSRESAERRHAEADARDADHAARLAAVESREQALAARIAAHESDRAAAAAQWRDAEAAHATLNNEIAARHAQAQAALTRAQTLHHDAQIARAEAQMWRDQAAEERAAVKAALAALSG